MAWTALRTYVTGEIITATILNTDHRDNLKETAPALVTTDGDMVVATGANALKRIAMVDTNDRILHERGGIEADISALTTGGIIVGQSAGVAGLETPMTQAQAEAGTETQVRGVTAERIKQAILALSLDNVIRKSASETVTNSATLQNDDHFTFSIAANEIWAVSLYVHISTLNASADFRFSFTLPASASMLAMGMMTRFADSGTFQGMGASHVNVGTTPGTAILLNTTATDAYFLEVHAILRNSATSGNATFQWAQGSAHASNLTLAADSFMLRRLL